MDPSAVTSCAEAYLVGVQGKGLEGCAYFDEKINIVNYEAVGARNN